MHRKQLLQMQIQEKDIGAPGLVYTSIVYKTRLMNNGNPLTDTAFLE